MDKTATPTKIVFVPNKSGHDFSKAERFGRLFYLSEGIVSRLNVNQIHRAFASAMVESRAEDFILITGLNILNSIACSIQAKKFGQVNFLMYKMSGDGNHDYVARSIFLD